MKVISGLILVMFSAATSASMSLMKQTPAAPHTLPYSLATRIAIMKIKQEANNPLWTLINEEWDNHQSLLPKHEKTPFKTWQK
jgi:hypothetical protein